MIMQEINTIGKRIQILRKQKGMSVTTFAKAIGKSRATVYRYEDNEIEEIPYTVLIPIANVLNTTPEYLMGFESNKTSFQNPSKKLITVLSQIDFTKEEVEEIINYSVYLLSKRK